LPGDAEKARCNAPVPIGEREGLFDHRAADVVLHIPQVGLADARSDDGGELDTRYLNELDGSEELVERERLGDELHRAELSQLESFMWGRFAAQHDEQRRRTTAHRRLCDAHTRSIRKTNIEQEEIASVFEGSQRGCAARRLDDHSARRAQSPRQGRTEMNVIVYQEDTAQCARRFAHATNVPGVATHTKAFRHGAQPKLRCDAVTAPYRRRA